jgi:3-deoxy-manno-octulosonate cytidylyltransferase (CMP-KDO synthetase)
MRIVIVIAARFRSSRFPGKPLAPIAGMPLIQHVHQRCMLVRGIDGVYVATDDERIAAACAGFDAACLLTSPACLTGTDRVWDAAQQIAADVYVNVQGDEPLVRPSDIERVIAASRAAPNRVFNAMCPLRGPDEYRSPHVPKVVVRPDGRLLYMSRAAIPTDKAASFCGGFKQVCIYALPRAALAAFAGAGGKTPLETIEDIEILRFLELGFEVHMLEVSGSSVAVDRPEDILVVEAALREVAGDPI